MSAPPKIRRVLVATDHTHCPRLALEHARAVAGRGGEVILVSVLVIPVTQPLDANVERSLDRACGVLDDGERAALGDFDTRLVRSRSFAKGVAETLAAERFDLLVLECDRAHMRNGAGAQALTLLEKAPLPVVLVSPL